MLKQHQHRAIRTHRCLKQHCNRQEHCFVLWYKRWVCSLDARMFLIELLLLFCLFLHFCWCFYLFCLVRQEWKFHVRILMKDLIPNHKIEMIHKHKDCSSITDIYCRTIQWNWIRLRTCFGIILAKWRKSIQMSITITVG